MTSSNPDTKTTQRCYKQFRPVLLTTKTQMCLPNINKLSTYRDNTFLDFILRMLGGLTFKKESE